MISIVTPTYNRAQLVLKTIESILHQTSPDWELVIVDDGSTDNTTEVVQKYLSDTRIKYIKKENSGATESRNIGAAHSTGSFITFLDSDDEALPTWLENVYECIDNETAYVCVGAVRKFSDGKEINELPWAYQFFGEKLKVKFTCGSFIINRNIFNEVGGYDVSLRSNQHTDLGYRILNSLRGKHFKKKYIDKCLIQINIHDGVRIRTSWKSVNEGSIQFIEKHYNFLRESNSVKHISKIYSVIAFSSYKMNERKKSLTYLAKAIKHNPYEVKNYLKIFKYGMF